MNKLTNHSQVQVLFGPKGIRQAYQMTLNAKVIDIKCLSKNYAKVIGSYFDKQYWPKVLKSKIKTREILLNKESNRVYAAKLDPNKNQAAFLEKKYQSETDFIIYDNTLILISFNLESPFAIVIKDKSTAKSMKDIFKLLWQKADK